jgi:hypothetical protein
MTALAPEPGISAREALQAGACSASCLLSSQETRRCRCTCAGTYHGILLRYITSPAQPAGAPNRAARRRHRKGRKA